MKTILTYNTKELIKQLNSSTANYKIEEQNNFLSITKIYGSKRGRPFSVILPKEIKISSEVVGLIVGEGHFGERHFVFANSNGVAIEKVLNFLEQFNIPIKKYLEISMKNKPKSFIKECKKFWEKEIGEKIERIRIRKEFNNITPYGTIHLNINNVLIANLFKQIIPFSKDKIEKKKQLSIDYLRGIIAAEGNINIKKSTNCVYMVRISASKQEERNHYKRCLKRAGLKLFCKDMPTVSKLEAKQRGWKTTKGRAGAVIISRWENFIKILELDLLDLSADKKEKFLKYFKNNKFTQQFLDFTEFIDKEFTMKQVQTYLGFSGRHLGRVLTLYNQGYLSRKKVNKRDFIYWLTEKYLNLYKKFVKEGITN